MLHTILKSFPHRKRSCFHALRKDTSCYGRSTEQPFIAPHRIPQKLLNLNGILAYSFRWLLLSTQLWIASLKICASRKILQQYTALFLPKMNNLLRYRQMPHILRKFHLLRPFRLTQQQISWSHLPHFIFRMLHIIQLYIKHHFLIIIAIFAKQSCHVFLIIHRHW